MFNVHFFTSSHPKNFALGHAFAKQQNMRVHEDTHVSLLGCRLHSNPAPPAPQERPLAEQPTIGPNDLVPPRELSWGSRYSESQDSDYLVVHFQTK